jgi:RNA polymerase sigma factor FliA
MDSPPYPTSDDAPQQQQTPITDRDRLIENNRPLVRGMVKEIIKTLPSYVDVDDVYANGYLGLVEAAEKYDPRYGTSFSTYAYYRIKGAIFDGLRKSSPNTKRLNVKLRFAANANEVLKSFLDDETSRPPNLNVDDEIAQAENVVDHLIPIYWLSLHADFKNPNPEDYQAHDERLENEELINFLLEQLSEEDREVIEMIYFNDDPQVEMAKRMGISKSWASRLHMRAIKNLRELMKKHDAFDSS